jgi:hypothetical protein
MTKVIDITGQLFGKLTAVKREGTDKEGKALWLCKCECGNETITTGKRLRKGITRSCGCIVNKHNMTATPTWNTWDSMMERCYRTSSKHYKRYGARGIKVHEPWHEFVNFYRDMGKRPEGKSLDRIDNNGNYEPGNCRWADNFTQNNNRGNYNTLFTLNGVTKTQAEWARKLGLKDTAIQERLRRGWSVEKALTTPCRSFTKQNTKWTYKEETKNLSQWAKIIGINVDTLHHRLKNGWTLETPLKRRAS